MKHEAFDTITFTHKGHEFSMGFYYDSDIGEPWKEHDCHGIVSEWTSRDKGPGEWVLAADGRSRLYYDYAETLKLAKRDGWGIGDETKLVDLERRLGHKPTKREITAEAVRLDYEYLKGWCGNEWCWCGVAVTSEELGIVEKYGYAVWGVESCCEDYRHQNCYHMEIAREQADEIIEEWSDKQAQVLA